MRCVGLASLFLFFALSAPAQSSNEPLKTGRIYVGSFGMGDDAEQLKLALGYELGRVGLKVVDFQAQSDSVLSGLIVTRMESGKPVKRVTSFLKSRDGKTVWTQDFGPSDRTTNDLRQRAVEIARRLKRDASPKHTRSHTKQSSMQKSPTQ